MWLLHYQVQSHNLTTLQQSTHVQALYLFIDIIFTIVSGQKKFGRCRADLLYEQCRKTAKNNSKNRSGYSV